MRHLGLFLADDYALPARPARSICQHLRVAATIQRNEQEGRLIHGPSTRNHTVVLQNDAAAGAHRARDACTLLGGDDSAAVTRIHR